MFRILAVQGIRVCKFCLVCYCLKGSPLLRFLGFWVWGLGIRAGFRVLRVWGLGFRFQGVSWVFGVFTSLRVREGVWVLLSLRVVVGVCCNRF